jgi:hypothetical protein
LLLLLTITLPYTLICTLELALKVCFPKFVLGYLATLAAASVNYRRLKESKKVADRHPGRHLGKNAGSDGFPKIVATTGHLIRGIIIFMGKI